MLLEVHTSPLIASSEALKLKHISILNAASVLREKVIRRGNLINCHLHVFRLNQKATWENNNETTTKHKFKGRAEIKVASRN